MTLKEKAEEYIEARNCQHDFGVWSTKEDDAAKEAYQAGYKEALGSVLRFLEQYGTNGQKGSCMRADLNDFIKKELSGE